VGFKAERKQVNPLREELYNEQMSSQGSTAGFITWTIQNRREDGGGAIHGYSPPLRLCPRFAQGYSLVKFFNLLSPMTGNCPLCTLWLPIGYDTELPPQYQGGFRTNHHLEGYHCKK